MTQQADPASDAPAPASEDRRTAKEPRWPIVLAILVLMLFSIFTPTTAFGLPTWVFVLVEGSLLVSLILWRPDKIDRGSQWTWRASVFLVALVIVSTLATTLVLIRAIVLGEQEVLDAISLLLAGARIWVSLNIAFALLYWQFDGDGPAARRSGQAQYPDFVFPQMASPEFAPPGWRPWFEDYLFLSLTNANAFSPADTVPFTRWAKAAMEIQALVSFVIIGLVIARAISDFV